MKKAQETEPVKAAILGTLVADSSALGLHWIYSQGKIAQVVKSGDGLAEFLEPDEKNYEGVPAFFAHRHKHAGDASNYGEYIYVLLRSIRDEGFDQGEYVRVFQEYFGPGGEYVGYADGPMRETIYNIARLGKEIHAAVMQSETSLDEKKLKSAAHYIARYYFEHDTEGLKKQVRTPLKLQQWSSEELSEADRLVEAVSSSLGTIGSDDDQMPALSRSAVLAYFHEGPELDNAVEQAVRITNNNDKAVSYSQVMARIMRELYTQGRPESGREHARLRELVEENVTLLDDSAQDLIRQALAYEKLDYRRATKTFGAACHVDMAVPLVLHILLNTSGFTEANRINILASGDSCGRAIMLGAIAGAMWGIGGERGIPRHWIDKTHLARRVMETEGGKLLLG